MKTPTLEEVKHYIQREVFYITDPRMDGYTTWTRKQRLYEIKFLLDKLLKTCPTYSLEDEWLEEQKMVEVQKILEGKKS